MRFKQARLSTGLSVSEVARRSKVHRSSVHNIESGAFCSVRLETALRLSRAIGVNPAEIEEFQSAVKELDAIAG